MQQSARIIETVDTDWYKEVGASIFISQVYNMFVPQVTVITNVLIDLIMNIGKWCKTLFYTADDVRMY